MSNILIEAIQNLLHLHTSEDSSDLTASKSRPIGNLSSEPITTGFLVLYSWNGAPLKVQTISANAIKDAQGLGNQGIAATYRVVETGAELAESLARLIRDLFVLPLNGGGENGESGSTVKKRGRKPGSTNKANATGQKGNGAKKKRGRPAKIQPAISEDGAPAKKRRGRPPGSGKKAVDNLIAPTKKSPGRPKKAVVDGMAPAKKGPGRPRKNPVVVDEGSPAPAKRKAGRPRKSVTPDGAAPAKKKAGRPRKNPIVDTTAPKRGPGRPRKNPA